MKTHIINTDGIKFDITGLSAGKIADMEGVNGNIGKTSILEMLRDHSIIRKGWSISEEEEKPVEEAKPDGMKRLRNRKPSIIRYYPTDKLMQSHHTGDFGCYVNEIKKKPGIEASELASKMGWERKLVTIIAARARREGLICQQQESQAINARRKEPGNLFLQSLTMGGYGNKMNVWMGKNTKFNFA